MNQELRSEPNKSYQLILKTDIRWQVAFLGEKAKIHGNPCYYLYHLSINSLLYRLSVTTIGREAFISEGQTISPIEGNETEPRVIFMQDIDQNVIRDKNILILLLKLKEAGLEGVSL